MGLLLEVPQTQFIVRVGLSRGFGGDVGVGIFRAPPGCPGVERSLDDEEFFVIEGLLHN